MEESATLACLRGDHLPVGGARRSLIPRAEADAELDVRSRRRQVQERADHAPVLLLVHRLTVQVLIKRRRCADRSRLRRQVKASRPLIRVLVINDNGLWINDFI